MAIENSIRVVEVMALDMAPPVVVEETATVGEAVREMRAKGSGYVLLAREGTLRGIFTERDVLMKVLGVEGAMDGPVSERMTPHPVCIHETDPIRNAVVHMHKGGFRNVPVVDAHGGIVGCVRHKDIVHYMVEHFAQHVLNLPPDPDNLPDTREGG